jgi:transcriptional regulator with XRE-family HTH domain
MPGHIIKKYRELKNYSQKYVATKMGISQNAYSKIENNITQLTVHHLKQLSGILEVPMSDLLKDEFEIHRPMTVPHTVSRAELLQHIEHLQNKLETKHAAKHTAYMVALSLIMAAESCLSPVH